MSLRSLAYHVYRNKGLTMFFITAIRFIGRMIAVWTANLASRILDPKPELVLFHNHNRYEGNSRYVFEWIVNTEYDDVNPCWITHSYSLYRKLRGEDLPVVFLYSIRGLKALSQATVFCYDSEKFYNYPDRLELFRLCHESPIKGGAVGDKKEQSEYDHRLVTSEFLVSNYSLQADTNVVSLGFPRDDQLSDPPEKMRQRWMRFLNSREYSTVFLYAPTERIDNFDRSTDLFPFDDFDKKELFELLDELDALLLIRLHPDEHKIISDLSTNHEYDTLSDLIADLTKNDRVDLVGRSVFDQTVEILPFVDVLISDYSTVYHTFLFLDRPILFFPYDYDQWQQKNKFIYDYLDNLPGPEIKSFSEFRAYVRDLNQGIDPHKQDRHSLREKIFEHGDSNSCERVAHYIAELDKMVSEKYEQK